jgi:serine racemase
MNAIMSLPPEQAAHGVVVHSSGNHAGAIALAAKTRGIPAYIVLPTDVPQARCPRILLKVLLKGK